MSFDIEISNGHQTAFGWRTSDPIIPSQGYGGHPIAARPKRKALTVYEGRQPFILTIPMLLYRGGKGVEIDRRALETMATTVGVSTENHPLPVEISTNFPLPVPPPLGENVQWWIEDLTWGEEVRNPPDAPSDPGHLTRKNVTVMLLERIDDVLLGSKGPTKTVKTNRSRVYRVKKPPDTLASIAAHQLGSASRWEELAKLNHIRSNGQLKNGMILHLPAAEPKTKKTKRRKKR